MAKLSQIPSTKLSQNIALTPQLIQAIKLFELNNIDIHNRNDIHLGLTYIQIS